MLESCVAAACGNACLLSVETMTLLALAFVHFPVYFQRAR